MKKKTCWGSLWEGKNDSYWQLKSSPRSWGRKGATCGEVDSRWHDSRYGTCVAEVKMTHFNCPILFFSVPSYVASILNKHFPPCLSFFGEKKHFVESIFQFLIGWIYIQIWKIRITFVICFVACMCFGTGPKLQVFGDSCCVVEDLQRRPDAFCCCFAFVGKEKNRPTDCLFSWCAVGCFLLNISQNV